MKSNIAYRKDTPECGTKLAFKRTRSLIDHYGRNIATTSIEQLAASCYLQGVEDVVQIENKIVTDYEI